MEQALFSEASQALMEGYSPPSRASAESWRQALRELRLRKREYSRAEYLEWLRKKRESALSSLIAVLEASEAGLFYEALLPLLRQEIREAERGPQEQTSIETFQRDMLRLVMEGRLGAALDAAYRHCEREGLQEQMYQTVHLLSEFNHYEEKEQLGVLSQETLTEARNRIRKALLDLVPDITQR